MIKLDGSFGEGGGAIVRQALALSTLTGLPFTVDKIRAGRPKPGLKPQHLFGIKALQDLCNAHVEGAEIGSTRITYAPREIKAKNLKVDIGTAGSITLLMQSLLIPCIFAKKSITIELTGGTDVAWSQPIDYFRNILIPQLKKYADITCETKRRGYYPKGGGQVTIRIKGKYKFGDELPKIELFERDDLLAIKGVSHASRELEKANVAARQMETAHNHLKKLDVPIDIRTEYCSTLNPGSGICLWAIFGGEQIDLNNPVILGGDSLGERGKKSEKVGEEAVVALLREISSEACADHYLADQLIPFLALARGKIKTSKVSDHVKSNIYVTEKFLKSKFRIENDIIEV
ncbi:MAG: RNA 3'-terminal phosphate cyclase [archaeon]